MAGVFSALALIFMLAGGIIPIATFMAPALAGLCLIPVSHETGYKTGLLAYLAVSILALIMVPDREMSLFFLFLLGYYPILLPWIARLKNGLFRFLLKLALFNGSVACIYGLLLLVFASPGLLAEFSSYAPWFWLVLLAMGNITFLLYDNLTIKLWIIYLRKIRKRFFR